MKDLEHAGQQGHSTHAHKLKWHAICSITCLSRRVHYQSMIGIRRSNKLNSKMEMPMKLLKGLYCRIVAGKVNQRGQTMVEYVLIVAAIAVAGYVAYQGLETGINGIITKVTASLNAA
jgi:Flp pilus assembly pilin Flp